MTRLGDIEQITQSVGKCSSCGKRKQLGNGVCTNCWDKGHGRGMTRQQETGEPVYSRWNPRGKNGKS